VDLGEGITRTVLPDEVEMLVWTGMEDANHAYVYHGDVLQDGDDLISVIYDAKKESWSRVRPFFEVFSLPLV